MIKSSYIFLIIWTLFSCTRPDNPGATAYKYVFPDPGPDTNSYEKPPPTESFDNVKLRVELQEIYHSDQAIRISYIEAEKRSGKNSDESRKIYGEWERIDSVNREKVIALLERYGWLSPYEVGDQGSMALWLVIQHSDLETQQKYLPMMRRAVKENKAKASELALLEDRVRLGLGEKQIFGSQLVTDSVTGHNVLAPIEDEVNVNKRRASVGLEPLEVYAKRFDIEYSLPGQ